MVFFQLLDAGREGRESQESGGEVNVVAEGKQVVFWQEFYMAHGKTP